MSAFPLEVGKSHAHVNSLSLDAFRGEPHVVSRTSLRARRTVARCSRDHSLTHTNTHPVADPSMHAIFDVLQDKVQREGRAQVSTYSELAWLCLFVCARARVPKQHLLSDASLAEMINACCQNSEGERRLVRTNPSGMTCLMVLANVSRHQSYRLAAFLSLLPNLSVLPL
jgi:hypothetical protein